MIKNEEINRILSLKKYHNFDTQKFKELNILFFILFGENTAKNLIEKLLNEKKLNNIIFFSQDSSNNKISNLINKEKWHAEMFLNQIYEIKSHLKSIVNPNKINYN